MAQQGGRQTLVDLNEDGLKATQEQILQTVPDAPILLVTANVTDEEHVQHYVDQHVATFGAIDGFFNNAGFINGTVIPIDGGQHIKY
ncbi:SDR family oxidoreductase [Citricoccus nitrophenolicus]